MANFLPRLCFHSTSSGDLLSGNGPFVDVIRSGSILKRISVFSEDCNHVFGVIPTTNEDVFVFGERSLAYLPASYLEVSSTKKLDPSCVTHFPDTVMQAKVLDNDKIVLLFTCNTTVLYNFSFSETNGLELKEKKRVQSAHTAVMLKGLLLGDAWENLITIVGTVFGEILVSKPGKSSEVVHKYEGHTGMIFGLCLWQNFLLSISDDRSLRVWSFDENSLKSGVELACEYGHSARPFAIIKTENRIYTAGVDRTVCVWTFDVATKSLKICDRITLNIGGIRSLAYHENHLWCGSETGGLLGVRTARPSDGLALEHCDDLRGFALEHDNLYTVDGSGTVYRNGASVLSSEGLKLRYLVASPSFYTAQAVVAYGEKNAVVFAGGSEFNLTCDFRILSVVCTATHVLLYAVNKKAYLYTVTGDFICVISAEKSLSGIHKKTSLIPSAMVLLSGSENSHTLIIGSSSGQMLFCDLSLDASKKKEYHFSTDSKVNREFGGNYVMSLRSINDDVIMGLGKNGKITCWRVGSKDGVSFLSLLSLSFVSSSVPLDWPCSIVILNGKEYITGFHSTTFHLIDSESGLSVMSCEIGGGNRAWQFRWNEEEQRAMLYWIRHQRLSFISYELADFLPASPSLHLSQIVFVRVIFPSEGRSDVIVCTGSIDNHIVFSGYDSETEEWTILWRQSSDVGFICMTSDSLSSPFDDNSVIAVTGGGKGLLTAWKVSRKDLCSRGSSFLSPLCKLAQYEHSSCIRVVDVDMYKMKNVDEFGVLAAHADGSIDLYSISSESTQFTLLSIIQPPDYSLFSKVSISRFDDVITASAISTSGRLSRFKVEEKKLEKIEELPVARCGLSAVATYRIPEGYRTPQGYSIPACVLTAVGDESGEVAICVTSSDQTEHICTVKYHCATVTDLCWSVQNEDISIISTSLDCQLVKYSIDLRGKKATFVRARPLAIWDPSSFVVDRSDVIAVGSGLECVKWE